MTLGEQIQTLRKSAGLSQEELGDKLGVARQSVSKWESDATVPELDKLIAMSRLFGVTIGALLGLEEPAEARREFTEQELSSMVTMVEKLALADIQEKLPAPEPVEQPKKKLWPKVVGGIAAVIAVLLVGNSFKNQLSNLQSQVNGLTLSMDRNQLNVSNQINSLTGQLKDILEQQNSVTAEKSYTINHIDPIAETVTFSLSATPRQYQEGMTAQFIAEGPDFETVTVPGTLEGQRFTADLVCPLADDITLSMAFRAGETTQNQGLDRVRGLKSDSYPSVYATIPFLYGTQVNLDGTLDIEKENLYINWADGYLDVKDGMMLIELSTLTIRVIQDGEEMLELPIDLTDQVTDHNIDTHYDLHLTGLQEGSRVQFMGDCTDSLGRKYQQWLAGYVVEEYTGGSNGRAYRGWRLEWEAPTVEAYRTYD